MRNTLSFAFASLAAVASAALSIAMTVAPVAGDAFGGDPYPLDTCAVSGEKLGADAVTTVLSRRWTKRS